MRTLIDIKPLNNYRLKCLFIDGTEKIADIKPFLDKEAFRPLADPPIFASTLYNGGYFVSWKDWEVDVSADTLWHISAKA